MTLINEIRLLSWRALLASLRNPVFLFMGVMMPLLYLALFSPLLSSFVSQGEVNAPNVLTLFVPGMLSMIGFSTGLFTGFGMIDEVRSGVIERLRVSPASRFSILSGCVLHDICAVFFQSLFFVLIALPFGFRVSLMGLLMIFALIGLLTTITSSFGNAMGLITKSEDRFAPIIHGVNLPIMLLSGMLLPISLAPKWLKVMAHFNPVYYVVEASRALALGHFQAASVWQAFVILSAFAFITMRWATNVFKKSVT